VENTTHSYHFGLKKDHGWMWIIALPFGLICWAIPFVLNWGLIGTGLEQDTTAVIAFLFLGVPAYLVGWIFVYSFMEIIITRVSFSDSAIYHRTPFLIFPIFWRTKKIIISEIDNIDFMARYGSRFAILLFIKRGDKLKRHFLPRFRDQPEYLKEFEAFSKNKGTFEENGLLKAKTGIEGMVKEQVLAAASANQASLRTWNRILKLSSGLIIFTLIIGCGYYCMQLPVSVYVSFSAGASVGMALVLLCLVTSIPVLGQGLIWFFGRGVVAWLFSFVNVNSGTLFMPASLHRLLREWLNWDTSRLSLTDFTFWCVFLLSVLYSVDRLVRRFKRKS